MLKNIFIVHYKKLTDRRRVIENSLNGYNITNYEFREKYQREYLTDEIKNKYFVFNNLSPLNNLSSAQICITIEHIEIFREIIENNYKGWCLILEDDALFSNNFVTKLNKLLENVPHDAEYLDIADFLIYILMKNG
jgi:GR25 family glycosyltransferase involved in LPS biosynthesis